MSSAVDQVGRIERTGAGAARRRDASSLSSGSCSRHEPTWANPPAAPIERTDPLDPIDRIDPAEPTDRIDPAEPTDRNEPTENSEPAEKIELTERYEPIEDGARHDGTDASVRRASARARRLIRGGRRSASLSDQRGRGRRTPASAGGRRALRGWHGCGHVRP